MSSGPRIPLPLARHFAEHLMKRWGMSPASCLIVGSIRRGKPDVGDAEIIAPLPTGENDPLHLAIAATLEPPAMFAGVGDASEISGRALKGLKRGFKVCELEMTLTRADGGGVVTMPVQIARYTAGEKGNRGWIELMRTGPAEFGKTFLANWKKYHKIPWEKQASDGGFLLGRYGDPIPTPTEEECFLKCGRVHLAPENRR